MTLPAILQALTQEPLLLTPAAQASYLKMFEDHAAQSREDFRAERPAKDFCGADLPQAELVNGIYIIPVGGPIGSGLGRFEKEAGAVDCSDLCEEIGEIDDEPMCIGGILHVDSPGGMVLGIKGVADKIEACDKPIYAFTSGQMCSAAYWISCACDKVFATEDADVGSIGAYCYLLDRAKQYADAGVKPVLVTSGAFKGMGAPGVSLTKGQLAFLQERIDAIAEKFYTHVEAMRGKENVSREDMQGQVYAGDRAMSVGWVNDMAADVGEVADRLLKDSRQSR
jgi:signal peptide peptidase SppA